MSASDKITRKALETMKREARRIAMLTAYDASFARLLDGAGVDCVLVGDSLGHVIQGRDSTLPVSLDQMCYHTECVARGVSRAFLIADLPFLTYASEADAIASARALMQAGAEMVKLEGGRPQVSVIARLVELGVPVCGHLGLTPQSVHQLSGYRVQGRDDDTRARLLADAEALREAGIGLLVLECVPDSLGRAVRDRLDIPVIGIGAGPGVDGQVLVLHDALGLGGGPRPRFVRDFVAGSGSLDDAVRAFVTAVRDGTYPGAGESYGG